MRRLIFAGLIALLPAIALARAPMETNQLVDGNGNPIGTADNPLVMSGGTPASPTGSVTPAGNSGSQAQAVQGITGGVPVGISAASLPLPAGAATAANQATEIGSLATIAQRAVTFTDVTGLAVAANGTYTGTVRDLGSAPAYTRMNVAIYSAQNGTVTIQACQDIGCGAAFTVASQQVVVNTSVWATVSAPVYTRYMRLIFQNGSTAGNITVSSSFTAG